MFIRHFQITIIKKKFKDRNAVLNVTTDIILEINNQPMHL